MATLHINGRDYPVVPLDQFTLDEAIVLYEYSNLSLDQVVDAGNHPGITKALLHVAVARADPNVTPAELRRSIGQMPFLELDRVFQDLTVEDDADPPPASETGSNAGSGESSSPAGEPAPAANPQNGTGDPGSATGATSPHATLGA